MKEPSTHTFSFGDLDPAEVRKALDEFGYARICSAFSIEELGNLSVGVAKLMSNPPETGNFTWFSPKKGGGLLIQRISQANRFSQGIDFYFLQSPQLKTIGAIVFNRAESKIGIADGTEGSDGIVIVIKDPNNLSEHKDLRWHRDKTFTSELPINPFMNCGLYLDRSDSSRGALLVLPGSHRYTQDLSDEETTAFVNGEISVEADPGDIVIHRSDLLHRSGPHRVDGELRRVIYANLFEL